MPDVVAASLHVEAAVDVNGLPRDVGGAVAGQESYHLRHLPCPSDPPEGHLPEQALARLLGEARRHVRLDQPRRHRVDEDVPVRELAGRRLGQPNHARLGRRVVDLAGIAHGPGSGGNVDDAAALLPHHGLGRRPGHQEHAAKVRVHDLIPVVVLHAHQELVARHAGIVDQHVDASEPLLGRLHQPIAVFALRLIRGYRQRGAAHGLDLSGGGLEPGRVAARDYHGGAVLRQRASDSEPDAERPARYHHRAVGEGLASRHAAPPPPRDAAAAWRDSGSSTAWPRAPSIVRLSKPVSTRPGPTSSHAVVPSLARVWRQSVHRTGLATWRTRRGLTSSAVVVSPASTLRATGTRGACAATRSSSAASRSAAGFMRAEWKGALTGKSTLFFPPRAAAALTARSTAPRCPAITICPGELMLATFTTSPWAASAQACSAAASSSPSSAAMAPVPTGTASCMNSPRLRTSRTASTKPRAPAATRAEYSPRLWPAHRSGLIPRSDRAAATATLAVRMAGCVFAVRASSSSGPSKQRRERGKPRASSARPHTAAAAAESWEKARPMPTDCEPCPGKRKAIFMGPTSA